jgi:hypothetical protein
MSTPALIQAQAAVAHFAAALPPGTGADLIQLVTDLAQGVKAELNAAILANAPHIPLVQHFVTGEMVKIADDTVDNAVASLSVSIQTGNA